MYNEMPPAGLGTLLRSLIERLDEAVDESYSGQVPDMRPRYYPVMRILLSQEEAAIGTLAQLAGVSQPAMTQTVTQMRAINFVEPVESADRRHRKIRLSKVGLDAAHRLEKVWTAVALAADGLDADLAFPLSDLVRQAHAALDHQNFAARIAAAIEGCP